EFQSPDFSRRPTELYPSRLPILLVSKYFNRLAILYIYDSPKIGALSLTRQLRDCPDLGSFDDMLTILSYASNLEKIQPSPVAGQTAGGSLQEFSNMFPDACTSSSSVLAHFTELRAVSMMRLESPQTLKLPVHCLHSTGLIKFLNAHGGRLLRLTIRALPMEDLKLFDICRALVDIEFYGVRVLSYFIGSVIDPMDFEDIAFNMFPVLREMQMLTYEWPTTEREISKSKWVPLTKALLEKNIKLADSAGKYWIPRVKSTWARRR
ncbi:hypothetical protein C8R44DRAFT_763892, partial [Mycena epipterygia]